MTLECSVLNGASISPSNLRFMNYHREIVRARGVGRLDETTSPECNKADELSVQLLLSEYNLQKTGSISYSVGKGKGSLFLRTIDGFHQWFSHGYVTPVNNILPMVIYTTLIKLSGADTK